MNTLSGETGSEGAHDVAEMSQNVKRDRVKGYRVKYPYSPQKPDELQISEGDRVTNVVDADNGWVFAHNTTTGQTGLCPKDYLQARTSVKKRLSRVKNRMSSIYLNMTQQLPSMKKDIFTISHNDSIQFDRLENDNNNDHNNEGKPQPKPSARMVCYRIFVGLLGGLFLGGLLFVALRFLYTFTVVLSAAISGVITLVMCLSLIVSPRIRCVAALMSVTVFTSQGRVALLSLIPGLLIAGPLLNIKKNINEGANSVGCMGEIIYNQTLALREQFKISVTRQQQNLERSAAVLSEDIANITSNFNPFPGNKDMNETECLERLKQMQKECRTNVDSLKANLSCEGGEKKPPRGPNLNQRPNRSLPSFGKCQKLFCSTLDSKVLCSHLDSKQICQTSSRSRRSITSRRKSFKDWLNKNLGFQVNSTRVIDVSGNSTFNPLKQIQKVEMEVEKNINKALSIITILNRILIIFIILAFINAFLYQKNYLKTIKYDNVYLTSEFRRLNRQLKSMDNEKAVFPLKKKEKKKYIDSTSLKLCRAEAFAWKVGMSQVLFHIGIGLIFILMDCAVFYLLLFVRTNGGSDIFVTGGAFLEVDVEGAGPVAEFVRNIFDGTNSSTGFQNVLNFKPCLPNASEPSQRIIYLIVSLYVLLLLVVLLQAYGLRLRHKMMAFFFPEREAERIHYLYRHILLKRRVFVDEETKMNLLTDSWSIQDSGRVK